MNQDVILYDILMDIILSMRPTGVTEVFPFIGRKLQILSELNDLDNSITYKDRKYPFCAVELPIFETRGNLGYYSEIKIPRIVFAALNNTQSPDVSSQYASNGNFKTILYPCYYEFLIRAARSRSVISGGPDFMPHTKFDSPGVQPIGKGFSDYVDTIEILNLELIIKQTKIC